MKIFFRTVLIFLFILIVKSIFANCPDQDSIVVKYFSEGGSISGENKSITIDTFKILEGRQITYLKEFHDDGTVTDTVFSSYYKRKSKTINGQGQLTQEFTEIGSSNGWINFSIRDISYHANGQIISDVHQLWVNGNWEIAKQLTNTFDASGLLIQSLQRDTLNGVVVDKLRETRTYNGSLIATKLIEKNSGGGFENDRAFSFLYTGQVRDSVLYQKWDTVNTVWINYGPFAYSTSGTFTLEFATGNALEYTEKFEIDTLENILFSSIRTLRTNPLLFDQVDEGYTYVNGVVTKISSYGAWYEFEIIGPDTSLVFMGREWNNQTYYDTLGRLEMTSNSGGTHTSTWTTYYQYYEGDILSYINRHLDHVNNDYDSDKYFYYSSRDSIFVVKSSWDNPMEGCLNDTLQTHISVLGGCRPYTYSWTPGYNLTDSLSINTQFIVDTNTVYTLTVTDSLGVSNNISFPVTSHFPVNITQTNIGNCNSGCSVLLTTQRDNFASYQWFRDEVALNGATDTSLYTTASGVYHVEVTNWYCSPARSDKVNVLTQEQAVIIGRLFSDNDSNCIFNGSDAGLSFHGNVPWIVEAQKGNTFFRAVPDSNGYFEMHVDTGTYNVHVIEPQNYFYYTCPANGLYTVSLLNSSDTISNIDFAFSAPAHCNRLRVSATAGFFRPCFPNIITINYCNEGLDTEYGSEIHLTLPPEIIPLQSSLPWISVSGRSYTFLIDSIEASHCNSFNITSNIECSPNGLAGGALCFEVEIDTIDFCSYMPIDSSWDESSIKVSGYCDSTEVCFVIGNRSAQGTGDMSTSSEWRLFADNILLMQGNFQLDGGEDSLLCFASDGKTFRLEADQSPGHPGNSHPHFSIERCGFLQNGSNYSLGQIMTMPPDNEMHYYYQYCSEIRVAIDPNDKHVVPSGITSNHFVLNSDLLEYRINFQNTGNDFAFNVVIRDTINTSLLDISTISLLGGSHPFTFSIEGDGLLIWRFENILLPDSNNNEPASHGFVSFSIKPKNNLPNGTVISNLAYIYFDFNLPVVTPAIFNTICQIVYPEIEILVSDSVICSGESVVFNSTIIHGGTNPEYNWYINGVSTGSAGPFFSTASLSNYDTISCTLSSNYMCALPPMVGSNNIVIRVNTPVAPVISFTDTVLTTGPALTYQWYLDGISIPGANLSYLYPLQTGFYSVLVIDSNSCISQSVPLYITVLNIKKYLSENILIYPNPTINGFYLEGITLSKEMEIKLYDINGRLLSELYLKKSESGINNYVSLPYLADNIYVLMIKSGETIIRKKLMVSRR